MEINHQDILEDKSTQPKDIAKAKEIYAKLKK